MQQQALADTGKRHVSSLTAQEKALARIEIIFQDTAQAQGDYQRTSDGLANQSRTLEANLDDLQTMLGQHLVPALTDATTAANDFLSQLGESGTAANDFVRAMGVVGDALGAVKSQLGQGFKDALPGQLRATLDLYSQLSKAIRGTPEEAARAGPHGDDVRLAQIKKAQGAARNAAAIAKSIDETLDPDEVARRAALRRQWFDAVIGRREDRVQDISSLQGQLTELRAIAALISERIKITKDTTRRLDLEDQLIDVQRQERGVLAQMKENTATLAAERKELAEQAAIRRATARNARQYRALGLTSTGEERAPGVDALRKQFGNIKDSIKGTILDTKANNSLLAGVRKVLTGGLGVVGRDLRLKIKQILDEIDNDLKERGNDVTKFRHVSTDRLIAGLGLSREQALAVKNRIAAVGPNGTLPAASAQFALAGGTTLTVNGGLHLHNVNDIRQLESQFTKRAKARATVRRGART